LLGRDAQVGTPEYDAWTKEARKFGKAIWDITGKGNDVDFVFEHPGEQTFPVSCLVVKRGGMVVFCAGTTGYNITFDARYRLDAAEAHPGLAFRQSAAGQPGQPADGRAPPRSLHVGSVSLGRHSARPHQDVEERALPGNMAVLVNAQRPGLRTFEDVRAYANRRWHLG
jgi:crotonyl-CoA carboxylase/reductase